MDIIIQLTKDEVRSFKLYLKKYASGVDMLLTEKLFNIYRNNSELKESELKRLYFNDINSNTFYQLKSRMIENLYKSLLQLNYKKDEKILIQNYLILAEIFTYKSAFSVAYDLLKKAEKKAIKANRNYLLHLIYNEIIALSFQYSKVPINNYIERKRALLNKLNSIDEFTYISSKVTWFLRNSNFTASGISILDELETIKNKIEKFDLIEKNLNLKLELQKTIRNILLQKEDYVSLEIYLDSTLKEFEKNKLFNKANFNHKIVMQVWLINTQLKLKKFKVAIINTSLLSDSLNAFNKLYYNNYVWTYYQCKFIASYYGGDLKAAFELLKTAKQEKVLAQSDQFNLFLNLNSCMIFYSKKEFQKANIYLNKLLNPQIYATLPAELKMYIYIVDLIMYFESNDFDYLIYKINEFKRKFRSPLKNIKYNRIKEFIKILNLLAKKPNPFQNIKVVRLIDQFILNSAEYQPGSNETIDYKIWLLSKKNKQSYYEQLQLELP